MPLYLSYILQPLNISCFTILKYLYSRLIEQKISLSINHINKQEFIPLYQQAHIKALYKRNIRSSFSTTGLVPFNPEHILSVLHTTVQTPSPPPQEQEAYTTATPHNITQLEHQITLIKSLKRKRHTQSPPSLSEQALNQLVKGCQIVMHNAALITRQVDQLVKENKHQKQKRAQKHQYFAKGGIYTGQQAQELIVEVDNSQIEAEPSKASGARPRALPRCSLCTSLEHKANKCPERQRVI
jgi:hypothetical protein